MGCYTAGATTFYDILYCFLFTLTGGDSTILGLIILALVLVISYQARLNGTLALIFGFSSLWAINGMFGYTSEGLTIVMALLGIGIFLKILHGLLHGGDE